MQGKAGKNALIGAGVVAGLLTVAGCSGRGEHPIAQVTSPKNDAQATQISEVSIRAIGMGVIPEGMSSAPQALAMGKRAAIADAYRQIGEKIYGIKINATDTVKDMVAKNSNIKTEVNALVKNGNIEETVCQDGLCQVAMEVKIDRASWARLAGY